MSKAIAKKHEGLRLTAYPDQATGGSPWTIGYGHTRGVRAGDTCSREQAEAWFEQDWNEAARIVGTVVTVPLSEKQRDALTSFVFNVGPGAEGVKDGFVTLKNGKPSTMLARLNAGDYLGAAEQFDLWKKAAGKSMPGLVRRRGEEKAWFLSGTGINPEPMAQETPMAPFLAAAIPALIQALPDFARIFKSKDVAERNVEAVTKAADIVMTAVGASNVQEAAEKVQADPALAQAANTALRGQQADLLDMIERMARMDEDSIGAARVFSQQDKPVVGQWLFVHLVSMLFVLLGGGAAIYVLASSTEPSERVMALQTLLIVGVGSVAGFWLGSSRSSQVKDIITRRE